jgi:hypothetical protein
MTNYIYIPYTYLIGWSKLDKWYYGAEYGSKSKTANPLNLWKTYFTSSEYVKEFREQYGEPDIIQVRKIFTNENQCKIWEYKVLSRLNVINSDKWLNKSNNNELYITSEENSRQAKNRAKMKKMWSQQSENKHIISKRFKENNPMYREDVKQKVSYYTKKRIANHTHNFQDPTLRTKLNLILKKRIKSGELNKNIEIMSEVVKNSIWINNGVKEIRHDKNKPIPNNWRKGRIYKIKSTSGRIWITNGVNSKTILPNDEIPKNWYKGRIINKKSQVIIT